MSRSGADEHYINRALAEARKGLGRTSPNPAVGAVLVREGRIVAGGYHRGAGEAHAEVDCLRKVRSAAGATLYVTLEPCSTEGRTPPCVEYIIERGVRRVVIGTIDPNPQHRGRGVELLRASGIEVAAGILEERCASLNEAFNKWIVTGQPFVIAKCAMSLDGRLTRPPGESQWLSSAAARQHARALRSRVDAILVGAETIRRDDPRLTARDRQARRQPWRVVLSRSGRLPRKAKVFSDAHKERTLVYRGQSLRHVLDALGKREVLSVLIEGGGEVLSEALDQRLIDSFRIYLTPLLTGGNVLAFGGKGVASTAEALRLSQVEYERIGNDICVSARAQR
ncbi:MAG: bifunctional diaminohydroxyphosphoribosylaminopyrimidine deaminase/5-amino-6-(5-phosphoribosylamino)uracil reductase RibD [Verrucomicrobia bacterium]|nr:bifunctional diaminohydroxyphosphoribosylaminopyrimidine deaminase/5-amino-6-(5-phosphoribosylamino)uracil reductase RibD [Verrucomicrobiota bacterium]